jgi:hypothetical protein
MRPPAVWQWCQSSWLALFKIVAVNIWRVTPRQAHPPELALLPSLLSSELVWYAHGVMVQGTVIWGGLGDEDWYMLLSTSHRVYWRRGTKFKQSTKPNWKLWLWGRKSVPRSGEHPAEGGPSCRLPAAAALSLDGRIESVLSIGYSVSYLFVIQSCISVHREDGNRECY